MRRVRVDDVAPDEVDPGHRVLTDPLGTTDVAINRYDLPPDGAIGGGYHTHHQEEVFYVLAGVATFVIEEGEVEVGSGEAIRSAPGDFQHGYNAGEERLALVAIGAPPDSREVEDVRECTACGEVFHYRRPQFLGTGVGPDDPIRRAACPECRADAPRIDRPD